MSRLTAILGLALAASAQVHREGSLDVHLHCAVDLDAGENACMITLDGDGTDPPSHPSGKNYDLRLEPRGRHIYLEPKNGALLATPTTSPSQAGGCLAAQFSKRRLRVDGLPEGTYICTRTNEGRHAELRVQKTIASAADRAAFRYTTWEK